MKLSRTCSTHFTWQCFKWYLATEIKELVISSINLIIVSLLLSTQLMRLCSSGLPFHLVGLGDLGGLKLSYSSFNEMVSQFSEWLQG